VDYFYCAPLVVNYRQTSGDYFVERAVEFRLRRYWVYAMLRALWRWFRLRIALDKNRVLPISSLVRKLDRISGGGSRPAIVVSQGNGKGNRAKTVETFRIRS